MTSAYFVETITKVLMEAYGRSKEGLQLSVCTSATDNIMDRSTW